MIVAQVIVDGLVAGAIFAAVGVGFNVIYRSGRVFNIAQGELLLLATFLSATFLNIGWSPWVVFPLTAAIMAATGLLVQRLALQGLIGHSELALFVSTLGVLLILNGLTVVILGAEPRLYPQVLGSDRIDIADIRLTSGALIGTVIIVVSVLAVAAFFRFTKLGLAMTAVAEDHLVARSLGVDVGRSMALSWMLAGVLSTIATLAYMGGRVVSPDIASIALIALPVVLLAGVESILGVLIAAAIVGVGQSAAATWLDPSTGGGASALFPFVLMLVILLIRPQGLFGWRHLSRL